MPPPLGEKARKWNKKKKEKRALKVRYLIGRATMKRATSDWPNPSEITTTRTTKNTSKNKEENGTKFALSI